MNYPQTAKPLKANDAKLGGKYRMSNIRSFIALAYLLYICSEKKSSINYSDGVERQERLQIKSIYLDEISNYLGVSIDNIVSKNPLLTGQFEYILVAMERVFCLGSVKFNNSSYSNSKERTGGIRYPKTLFFSTNMLVLDLIISGTEKEIRKTSLYEWLQNKKASNIDFERKVTQFLTVCSQYSLFRTRKSESEEIIYRPIGIYEQLNRSGEVSIVDYKEQAGTSSIYNNVLKEELNPWLDSKRTDRIKFNKEMEITPYLEMLRTTLDIIRVSESDIPYLKTGFLFDNDNINTITVDNSIILTAIRTKPFLLLAGISGTGKSRIVREFAFKSCPKYLQDKAGTTPGNYCMIEVKPNWHDSTELLGYYSNLSRSYQFKKFVKFLVKAKMHPEVPFFVCLDEMNLAPVEQYFAEILSVLETRKHPKDTVTGAVNMSDVKTEVIVESQYFKELTWTDKDSTTHQRNDMTDKDWYDYFFDTTTMNEEEKEQILKYQYSRTLQTEGLTLPDNVVIIGTVNMDDTTHQFSRKVIDRAMTIEMNGGNLRNMFGGSKDLEYLPETEQKTWQKAFTRRYVTADEVLDAHPDVASKLMNALPARLEEINKALKGTPFEVSYRVLNELTIMVGVMLDANNDGKGLDDIINHAMNDILLMKILPRIEGDAEMFTLSKAYKEKMGVSYSNRLEWLRALAPDIQAYRDSVQRDDTNTERVENVEEFKEHLQTAKDKIQEMIDRLNNQDFTRFWP